MNISLLYNYITLIYKGNDMEDLIVKYLNRIDEIRKMRLMTMGDMVKEIGTGHQTLIRIKRDPSTCSIKTIKKIKKFVDEWDNKGDQ